MSKDRNGQSRARLWVGWVLAVLIGPAALVVGQDEVERGVMKRGGGSEMRGPSEGDGRGGYRSTHLGEEQIQQVMGVLRDVNPEMAARIGTLSAEEQRDAIVRLGPRFRWLVWTRGNDPEAYELRVAEQRLQHEATKLAERIRGVSGGEAERLKEELKPVMERQFEARIRVLEYELGQFERRIGRLRDELMQQREQKPQIIAERMQQLIAGEYPHPAHSRERGEKPDGREGERP